MDPMRLDALTNTDMLALFEQAVSSVEEVCSQLAREDWDRPTDLPGWSVKDNVSHLASYEAIAAGLAPVAEADVSGMAHVAQDNPMSVANEREIQVRRELEPATVLAEFRDATTARLKHLTSLDAAGWESDTSTFPWGEVPTAGALPVRVLDVFFHEQDIRRATGRPGHLDGAVARYVFERLGTVALARIVAKSAGAPDGSVVVWDVAPPGRALAVETTDGKGRLVDATGEPTVRFASDLETFLCLFGGRIRPVDAEARGRLTVDGDRALAGRVLDNVVVTP